MSMKTAKKLAATIGATIVKGSQDNGYTGDLGNLTLHDENPDLVVQTLQAVTAILKTNENLEIDQDDDGNVVITLGDAEEQHDGLEGLVDAIDAFIAREAETAEEPEEGEETGGRSVVPDKYKEQYKAAGHAGNCGDWLASTLIELTVDKTGYLLDAMCAIADANGAKIDHLSTTSKGWQGRHRMTARNLLVKLVAAKGALLVPAGIGGYADDTELKAPAEWCARNAPKEKTTKKQVVAKAA